MNSQIKVVKKIIYCVVVFVWLWAGWLGYECRRLKSSLEKGDGVDGRTEHLGKKQDETLTEGRGGSSEKIREFEEKLRDSENAARQATDEWLRCHAANTHVHWMENIPTQDVTLEELKELAPAHYNKILKLANERNEKCAQRKQERQTFVESIREEWLTPEEHQELRTYFQLLDAFDDDDDPNVKELGMEERKRLKEQAPSYWRIQDIVKKCCRRMAGGDDGGDGRREEEIEKEIEEIRSVLKAPYYEFILPEPTMAETSR